MIASSNSTRIGTTQVLGIALCCLLVGHVAYAWTPVDRTFLYFNTTCADTCTITFLETSWGEIIIHNLHRVSIGPDGSLVRDSVEQYFQGSIYGGRSEGYREFLRLRPRDGGFQSPFHQMSPMATVNDPVYDSAFWVIWKDTLFNAAVMGHKTVFGDSVWLRSHIDPPVCDKELELVYAFPFGIYKNYKVLEVLAIDRYLFVLTFQPTIVSSQTYDGVLIYRLVPER